MAARARSREVCLFIFPNCVGCEVAQWGAGESTRIRAGTDLNTNHSHTHGTATTDNCGLVCNTLASDGATIAEWITSFPRGLE